MSGTNLTKNFSEFKGLNAKSNDILRPAGYSSPGTINDNLDHKNQIEKRPGFKRAISSPDIAVGKGLYSFNEFKDSGSGDRLQKTAIMVKSSSTNGNAGETLDIQKFRVGEVVFSSSSDAFIKSGYDAVAAKYRVQIWEGQTDDTGSPDVDVSTPDDIADLVTAVGTLASVFISVDSDIDQTQAVDVIETIERIIYSSGAVKSGVLIVEDIENRSELTFTVPEDEQNVSMVSNKNILYAANGTDEIHRYDGRYFYPAGGPIETRVEDSDDYRLDISVQADVPSLAAGTYKYRAQLGWLDELGNIIWNNLTDEKPVTVNGTTGVIIDMFAENKRINFKQAEIQSINPGTDQITFTSSSHGFVVGDRLLPSNVRLFENNQSNLPDNYTDDVFGNRIEAVSGATVTLNRFIDFGFYTVGDKLTNGLLARVYRTLADGELFYEAMVRTTFESSTDTYQIYGDDTTAAAVTYDAPYVNDISTDLYLASKGQLEFFDDTFDFPPRCRYLTQFTNQLILSGPCDTTEGDLPDNLVYWADRTNIDAVPRGSNLFSTDTDDSTGVKGIYGDEDHLLVFKNRKTIRVTGDLAELQFRTDVISKNIGCESHFSIQKLNDGRTTFMSHRGPYAAMRGQAVIPLGMVKGPNGEMESLLADFFPKSYDLAGENQFNLSTCVAANHVDRNLNIFTIRGNRIGDPGGPLDDETFCFAYNYAEGTWHQWTVYDFNAGAADYSHTMSDGRLYTGLFFLLTPKNTAKRLYKVSDTNTVQDCHDHGAAIDFRYITHFEHLGSPSVDKRWIRCSIWSLNSGLDFSLIVNAICDWGNFNAGTILYNLVGSASPAIHNQKGKLASQKSRSMAFEMTNDTVLEQVQITGYDVEYQTPYESGIKA